jgi:hypothetical protein
VRGFCRQRPCREPPRTRWPRPTSPTPNSTPNGRASAPPTRTCRRRCRAIGRRIIASLSAGLQAVRNLLARQHIQSGEPETLDHRVTVTQTLFNGFQGPPTACAWRNLQVQSGREALRNVGQGVLLDAVTVYTNVLANQSLVDAQRANVAFLRRRSASPRKRSMPATSRRPTPRRPRRAQPRPRRPQRRRGRWPSARRPIPR